MPDCDTNRDNKKGREMNNLQIFKSPDFGQVRIIQQNGEPWFIGKDVAEILGYKKPENAIAVHVDD
uniref:BRO-N domain-containing protein n=1 Tax=Phascolarctobacterium succinatutens TaxID=626940 RepID=UPI003C6E437D